MTRLLTLTAMLAAGAAPAMAATGPFFSLHNTDFVVLIAFLVFIGILLYFGVPKKIGEALDKRAAVIKAELDEARALREEAQQLLASYERKSREVAEQAERIVAHARDEAASAAEQAKADMEAAVARRLKGAEEQIASAETAAVRAVRDRAVQIAVAAAGEAIAKSMTAAESNTLIDAAIKDVDAKLH